MSHSQPSPRTQQSTRPAKARSTDWLREWTLPGIYLLAFAASGWLILIANLFPIARYTDWIFPVVQDMAGLAASTLLLVVLGLTPYALRQLLRRPPN